MSRQGRLCYGLTSWEHIYRGTMVDKIYEVLSLAGKPLPLRSSKGVFPKCDEIIHRR